MDLELLNRVRLIEKASETEWIPPYFATQAAILDGLDYLDRKLVESGIFDETLTPADPSKT